MRVVPSSGANYPTTRRLAILANARQADDRAANIWAAWVLPARWAVGDDLN
jgi:hypothetical protein